MSGRGSVQGEKCPFPAITKACTILEGHSVECIYIRERSSDSSVNKTILKPRLALAACRQDIYLAFSRRKIPHSSAARWQPRQGCRFQ